MEHGAYEQESNERGDKFRSGIRSQVPDEYDGSAKRE